MSMQTFYEDKEISKGIFWFICSVEGENLSFTNEIIFLSTPCDLEGRIPFGFSLNSKNGRSNTHKNSWEYLVSRRKDLKKYEWNYFPRGRVEITHGRAIIYMNPEIQKCANFLSVIQENFHIGQLETIVNIDNSVHYKCTIMDEI